MNISYMEIARRIDKTSNNRINLDNHGEDILIDLNLPYSRQIEEIDFDGMGYTAYLCNIVDVDSESGQPEGMGIIFYNDEPVASFEVEVYNDLTITGWFDKKYHQLFYVSVRDSMMPVYQEPNVISINETVAIDDSTSTMKDS